MRGDAAISMRLLDNKFQYAWLLFFWNVTRRQTVSFLWSRQDNNAPLFVFSGGCYFHAFCGEATIVVRPAHWELPPEL
jgi:hypothetical protein